MYSAVLSLGFAEIYNSVLLEVAYIKRKKKHTGKLSGKHQCLPYNVQRSHHLLLVQILIKIRAFTLSNCYCHKASLLLLSSVISQKFRQNMQHPTYCKYSMSTTATVCYKPICLYSTCTVPHNSTWFNHGTISFTKIN